MTNVIRGELTSDRRSHQNTCVAAGLMTEGDDPVLAMCRALLAAGHDPNTILETYRGSVLCLRIHGIGHGAKLKAKETKTRGPHFVPYEPFPVDAVRPGTAFNDFLVVR